MWAKNQIYQLQKQILYEEVYAMPLAKKTDYTIDYIYSLPEGQRAELIDGAIYDMAPPNRI